MFLLVSVILSTGRGVLSQHVLQVVSQHALQQVSKGGGYPSMPCRFPGPHPRWEVEGHQVQVHSQGESWGGPVQAYSQGGSWGGSVWGVSLPGGLLAGGLYLPGGTPREADSGIRSMSGRYASYWNAFLFDICYHPPMKLLEGSFFQSWLSVQGSHVTINHAAPHCTGTPQT